MKLKHKLTLFFCLAGLLPVLLAIWVSYQSTHDNFADISAFAQQELEGHATARLTIARDIKKQVIEDELNAIAQQLSALSNAPCDR
jgi:hypothetical protein